MNNSFLYQIAKAYAAQSDVDLRRCLFVFPSRRSSLFFQKYLGQCSKKPLFSPDLVTIGDLFARLSPWHKGDKIELMYILWQQYRVVCRRYGRGYEDFDDFVSFGETLMGDFGDVDKYMADHAKLFALVGDLRELDSDYAFLDKNQRDALRQFWGVIIDGRSIDSEERKRFLDTWKTLDGIYLGFKEALRSRGIAYEGMIERDVAERILHGETEGINAALDAYSRIVVIGQNALSKCELALMDHIKRQCDGDFYWDYYGECLTDPANMASHFIRNYTERYPSKYKIDAQVQGRPEVKVVSVSSGAAQAKVAAEELEKSGAEGTAVVLPDETMLMPLLNSIPNSIKDVNVTMGYGLGNSAIASLMQMLANLQRSKRTGGGVKFYHKDVVAILNSPLVSSDREDLVAEIKKAVNSANMIYVERERFCGDELLEKIFTPVNCIDDVYDWQMGVIDVLGPTLPAIEKEFALGYYTAISHLKDLHIDMQLRTYFRFLREIASRTKVSFKGEPLSGLQVMGPLEVRAIDFDTLIILSVNEGVFPAKTQSDSMIPYNVRRGFGLPTAELFDSIAAYHFYRSIYRAKKVVLIYDSRTKGLMSGEESRFVKQLRYHYNYPLVEESVDLEIKPVEGSARMVVKTPQVMEKMSKLFLDGGKKAFSASVLNDYMACPLSFYYKTVQGLVEEDEVQEGADAGQFGSAYHNTMEELYKQLGENGGDVTAALLDKWLKMDIPAIVEKHLKTELKQNQSAPLSKRNEITANLIVEMVKQTLKRDKEYAPFTYIAAEKLVEEDFDMTVGGEAHKVRFKGYIDRQDRKAGGAERICDYKTGSVKEIDRAVIEPGDLDKVFAGEAKTTFQLLIYAMLKTAADKSEKDYLLAVYDVKQLFSSRVVSRSCPGSTVKAFQTRMEQLIGEIFNPDVPFVAADEKEFFSPCKWCPAKAICGR